MKKALPLIMALFTLSAISSVRMSGTLELGLSNMDEQLVVFINKHREVNINYSKTTDKLLMQLMSMHTELGVKYRYDKRLFVCDATYREEHYMEKQFQKDYLYGIQIEELNNCHLKEETPKKSISDIQIKHDIPEKPWARDYNKATPQ